MIDITSGRNAWASWHVIILLAPPHPVKTTPDPFCPPFCPPAYVAVTGYNFNVQMMLIANNDASSTHNSHPLGAVVERYEYNPFGERRVFSNKAGDPSDDPYATFPMGESDRLDDANGELLPYGLNDRGHQGLQHDEHLGHNGTYIDNDSRYLLAHIQRYAQRDPHPARYPDGMNAYAYYAGLRGTVDPTGRAIPSHAHPIAQYAGKKRPCVVNCNDAFNRCLRGHSDPNECFDLMRACHAYCFAFGNVQSQLRRASFNGWRVAGDVVLAATGITSVAASAKIDGTKFPKTKAALALGGSAATALALLDGVNNMSRFKGWALEQAILKEHKEIWLQYSPGDIIKEYGDEDVKYNCNIKGSLSYSQFREGFITSEHLKSPGQTSGFSIKPCHAATEVWVYYRVNGAEWNRAVLTGVPMQVKPCLTPDQIIQLESVLRWGFP